MISRQNEGEKDQKGEKLQSREEGDSRSYCQKLCKEFTVGDTERKRIGQTLVEKIKQQMTECKIQTVKRQRKKMGEEKE